MKRILFTQEMHQAIVEGRKNQTRRLPRWEHGKWRVPRWDGAWVEQPNKYIDTKVPYLHVPADLMGDDGKKVDEVVHRVYAHYEPGDIVIIREATRLEVVELSHAQYSIKCKYRFPIDHEETIYCPDFNAPPGTVERILKRSPHWRPSIHMFDFCARTKIKITRVWIERIQDISTEDILAEGIKDIQGIGWPDNMVERSARKHFAGLWDAINSKRGDGGWSFENNRYIFCYEFERVE